jgi:hypothetical protein
VPCTDLTAFRQIGQFCAAAYAPSVCGEIVRSYRVGTRRECGCWGGLAVCMTRGCEDIAPPPQHTLILRARDEYTHSYTYHTRKLAPHTLSISTSLSLTHTYTRTQPPPPPHSHTHTLILRAHLRQSTSCPQGIRTVSEHMCSDKSVSWYIHNRTSR